MVRVKVFATFREIVGTKELDLPLDCPTTVDHLLAELGKRHPRLTQEICDESGEIRRFVAVMLNGRHVQDLQGRATPLQATDVIALFPPVAGGAAQPSASLSPKLVFHGVPCELVVDYLHELGGCGGPDEVRGDGWEARLRSRETAVGSVRIDEVEVELSGEPAALRLVEARLRLKCVRAGG